MKRSYFVTIKLRKGKLSQAVPSPSVTTEHRHRRAECHQQRDVSLSHLKTVLCQLPPQRPVQTLDSLQASIPQNLKQDRWVRQSVKPRTGLCSQGCLPQPGPRAQCGHDGLSFPSPGRELIFTARAKKVHTDLSCAATLFFLIPHCDILLVTYQTFPCP